MPTFRSFGISQVEPLMSGSHRFPGQFIKATIGKELAVSVLDLVGMRAGESAGSAIGRSGEPGAARGVVGYKRYWLAEHDSIPGLACSANPAAILETIHYLTKCRA
jgi:hypothetical protein